MDRSVWFWRTHREAAIVIEEPVEFVAALDRSHTGCYIERKVGGVANSVSETKDLVLPNRVARRCARLSTLP
jgi:hypothetical protein